MPLIGRKKHLIKSTMPEITYASEQDPKAKRMIIRSIEAITGRLKLAKLAQGYEEELAKGNDFWEVVLKDRLRIYMDYYPEHLRRIPATGPVVCVANHPFGVVDGLMLCYLISRIRSDFKVLTNSALCQLPETAQHLLPISFEESREALRMNIDTRKEALKLLKEGGCIGIFPGGAVSTSAKPFSRAFDPHWKTFTAKMITKSQATVVPIYFRGQNSRAFQIASNLSSTLRTALLLNEVQNKIGGRIVSKIGRPLKPEQIEQFGNDHKQLMESLRLHTYRLGLSSKHIQMGKVFDPMKTEQI